MEDDGSRDQPGIAHLPRFHRALDVGNAVAAAWAHDQKRPYTVVLSTATPCTAKWPYDASPELSTLTYFWRDGCGRETPAAEAVAKERIVAAAKALNDALDALGDDERALVHCAWGQNRSNAVCVAWAVIFQAWKPDDAIGYAREMCRRQRTYANPRPLHNQVFVAILRSLRPSMDGSGATVVHPTMLQAWLGSVPPSTKLGEGRRGSGAAGHAPSDTKGC